MNFDPTISLDFIVVAAGIALFVIRLQSQMAANTRDIARTGDLLDKLEKRVERNEEKVAANQRILDRHLGPAAGDDG
jgi:hypothetical protein